MAKKKDNSLGRSRDELNNYFDKFLEDLVGNVFLRKLKRSGFLLKYRIISLDGDLVKVIFFKEKSFLFLFKKKDLIFDCYIKKPIINYRKELVGAEIRGVNIEIKYKNSKILEELINDIKSRVLRFRSTYLGLKK